MAKIYGYGRISTPSQSIDRQIRNILAEYPSADIRTEAYTGTKIHRPEWDKLLKRVQPGDTIVFDSVSRMSRDAEEGIRVYRELYNRGVELVFLKEAHINTAVYQGAIAKHIDIESNTGREAIDKYISGQGQLLNELMMDLAKEQIRLAFEQAEKEVLDLHERVKEGIREAKKNGKQIGQVQGAKLNTKKSKAVKEIIQKHSKDFGGSLNDIDCMKLADCARNTYYKYKAELKNQ